MGSFGSPPSPRAPQKKYVFLLAVGAVVLLLFGMFLGRSVGPSRAPGPAPDTAASLHAKAIAGRERRRLAEEQARRAKAKEILEPLYLSMKRIRTATSDGVSYMRYGELYADAHTRLSVVTDLLKSPDWPPDLTVVSAAYVIAMFNYAEALDVWRRKIESDRESWDPGQSSLVDAVAKRHSIEPVVGPLGPRYGVSPLLGRVWADAGSEVEHAEDLYLRAIGERGGP